MEIQDILLLSVIFFMVLLSGFFSGSETGLTGASRAKLHKLASEGNKRAKLAIKIREDKDSLIGTILLGNNVFNILASVLAANVARELFGDEGLTIVIATIVMTLLILIFGELMPKTYAFNNSDKVAMAVAPIWNVLVKLFSPIVRLIQMISNSLLRLIGLGKEDDLVEGVDALRGAIDMHHDDGSVIKDARDMLGSILDLSEIEVGDVMVHRKDTTTINIDTDPEKILSDVIRSGKTRLPIWEGSEDNIIGILIAKDVLKLERDKDLEKAGFLSLLREAVFIPETTTLHDQLENFRKQRFHMAMVVDEYGDLMGLVTLEDILEEIVGQIDDEHDRVIKGVRKQSNGSIKVRGNLSIRDLNREMGWNLPQEEDAHTIAGFVIMTAGRIPEVGEEFRHENFDFEVIGKIRNQITSIRIIEDKAGVEGE